MSELLFEVDGDIGHVTLNRPQARNALTFGMYEKLAEICRNVELGGDIKAIIVRGAGEKAFAAGTDMAQFYDFTEPQHALDYEATMDKVLRDVEMCPVPTIAAINGACTGGGAAIAAACDIRLCDWSLKFGFPIARTLGNCLSIGNLNRLAVIIGAGRVRELILTARLVGTEEAKSIGLIAEVLETPSDVHARAVELAGQMSHHAPLTMRAAKEALRRLRVDGAKADCSDLIVECYMSEDFKEGITAFLGKRKPDWKGK
ncbi:MAG: enoyl-CoA hydratase/isomerase family protein [Hyphomicrobiales bacterium]